MIVFKIKQQYPGQKTEAAYSQLASAWNTDTTQIQPHQISNTTNREQNDWCGNSTAQSQAPDDGYINVPNMLSTQEV